MLLVKEWVWVSVVEGWLSNYELLVVVFGFWSVD